MTTPRQGLVIRRLVFPTAAAVLTATVVIAPLSPAQASQPASTPASDACYDYAASAKPNQIATSPPVGCEGPHTAQTFYVRSLADNFGDPQQANSKKKLRAARACTTKAMNSYLGLSNTAIPSRFQIVTVFPTSAQWNAGERWMRCDVVLRGGASYTQFSGTVQQLVADTPREQFNFCTASIPGSRTKNAAACTRPKRNWIMVAEQDLGSINRNFPGSRSVERSAKRICQRIGNRYTVRRQFYPWWAIWPTRTGWQDGDRTAQCFVPYEEYLATTRSADQ